MNLRKFWNLDEFKNYKELCKEYFEFLKKIEEYLEILRKLEKRDKD